jgi:ferritin-like metal-binding protein YciE
MKLDSLQSLFVQELSDLQDVEDQLISALPKMAEAANSPELRQAIEDHLGETRTQAERLKRIADGLDTRVPSKTCAAMKGLIKEGEEIIKESGDPCVKDAALIAAAQRVEHYEIAAYGCARTFAELLGASDSADLLQASLNEEAAVDKKLTSLAESVINQEAASV